MNCWKHQITFFVKLSKYDINFDITIKINIYLWFKSTLIQLFDFNSYQMFTFEWESIKFLIDKYEFIENWIEEVRLLKTNTGNFLFIPLSIIKYISYSRFREVLNVDDINKQFADLGVQHKFKQSGLIIPMSYSSKIFIKHEDDDLYYLNQCKDICQVFKEKQIELKIWNLDRLLKINKLLPDDFYCINFKYINNCSSNIAEYLLSRIMNDLDWINLKFIEIYQSSILSHIEFQFWCNVLSSRITKFFLASIDLKFSLLSECLTVLSLCSSCLELKSVELGYFESDVENEDEVIDSYLWDASPIPGREDAFHGLSTHEMHPSPLSVWQIFGILIIRKMIELVIYASQTFEFTAKNHKKQKKV